MVLVYPIIWALRRKCTRFYSRLGLKRQDGWIGYWAMAQTHLCSASYRCPATAPGTISRDTLSRRDVCRGLVRISQQGKHRYAFQGGGWFVTMAWLLDHHGPNPSFFDLMPSSDGHAMVLLAATHYWDAMCVAAWSHSPNKAVRFLGGVGWQI